MYVIGFGTLCSKFELLWSAPVSHYYASQSLILFFYYANIYRKNYAQIYACIILGQEKVEREECACVCVCVWERESESEWVWEREGGREGGGEREKSEWEWVSVRVRVQHYQWFVACNNMATPFGYLYNVSGSGRCVVHSTSRNRCVVF